MATVSFGQFIQLKPVSRCYIVDVKPAHELAKYIFRLMMGYVPCNGITRRRVACVGAAGQDSAGAKQYNRGTVMRVGISKPGHYSIGGEHLGDAHTSTSHQLYSFRSS